MHRYMAAPALALLIAAPASAHQANPNYLSIVGAVTPRTPGITVEVLNRDDQLQLINGSDEDVVIYGYNDEPYARIDADGTVAVNTQSPAHYLNEERFGGARIPAGVKGSDPPQWKVLSRTRRFQWHDHRMHWMAKKRPPQVTDPGKRTKVFDWKVPLTIDGRQGRIAGQLFWTPSAGTPVAFLIVGGVVVVAMSAWAIVARRRRVRADRPAEESW